MLAARYVYLLALTVWLGGMIALGGIAAPAAFQVLQGRDPVVGRVLAGAVFGETLRRFHLVSYGAAGVMLLALGVMALLGPRPAPFRVRVAVIVAMLAVSLYSGIALSGRIERLRGEIGGSVQNLPDTDPRKAEFGRLHGLSTVLMLVNVAGGLVLLYWEARTDR
jgi:hypothetical protein